MTKEPNPFLEMFEDPEKVRTYADGPARFTPGFSDVHRMAAVLIQERVPEDAHVLVHGCGGGLELEAFALSHPSWRFVGVDPAKPMLDAAEARLGPLMERVELHHGYIDTAPTGPFDAATSLLTLHFLEAAERVDAISRIVQRLSSGAPFIAVHSSFPQRGPERDVWLSRYEAFAIASGVDPSMANTARAAVAGTTTMFDPERDIQCLRDAGLTNVTPFYSAFTWRGWVGYVP